MPMLFARLVGMLGCHEVPVTKAKKASTIARLFCSCLPFFLFQPSMVTAFCFDEAAAQHGLSPRLLRSIAMVESGCRPAAVHVNSNGSTDLGMMQVNSSWISKLGLDTGRLLRDPCYNVMTGAGILRQCVDRYGYTWEAVGCYNAFSRDKRVDYSWKILRALKGASPTSAGIPAASAAKAAAKTVESRLPTTKPVGVSSGINSEDPRTKVTAASNRPRSFYFRVRTVSARGGLENP
jgi:hypothetical protein